LEASLGKKRDPISKIPNTKKDWGCSKHEALSSNPSTTKKEKKKRKSLEGDPALGSFSTAYLGS
jgi:hypothetical protein